MRILVASLLFFFMQPAIAITKCILNGKVTYKLGACPKKSTTQFLIKDRYIEEGQLQKARQERDAQSVKDFIRMNIRPEYDENGTLIKPGYETVKTKAENEDEDSQMDAPEVDDEANARLLEMQRQLDQRRKELQQLQQQQQ